MRTALCAILLLIPIPGFAQEPLRISGKTMGSYYALVIDSAAPPNADQLQQDIEAIFADLNRQMSTWDPHSEISKFNNASDSTDWFPVSRDLLLVTTEARRLHTLTEGALEITLAPLIEAWGFGAADKNASRPTLKSTPHSNCSVRSTSKSAANHQPSAAPAPVCRSASMHSHQATPPIACHSCCTTAACMLTSSMSEAKIEPVSPNAPANHGDWESNRRSETFTKSSN